MRGLENSDLYDRKEGTRPQKRSILIALEDKKTSRDYFAAMRQDLELSRVLVVFADFKGSSPDSVVTAAKAAETKQNGKARKDQADKFDEVWVVFDTEGPQNIVRQKAARQAIGRARECGFLTAVSNPSFEVWILYHYEMYVKLLENGSAVCKKITSHNKKFKKNECQYLNLKPRLDIAIKNATKRYQIHGKQNEHTHPCELHPSTQIHLLVQSIMQS